MALRRRHVLVAGAMGLFSLVTGCSGFSKPGWSDVNREIQSPPGVTGADIIGGPGGGLGTTVSGTITLDVTADELPDAFEEAWRRGVEVIHEMFDPGQAIDVAVRGVISDGTEIPAYELLEHEEPVPTTMSHFYEHYGIG